MLAGMEHLLSKFEGIALIGLVSDSTALVDLLGRSICDVVVTDFSMPGGRYGDGLSLLRFLKRRFPAIRLVVLTSIENSAVMQGILNVGATGIVSKSDELAQLEVAIRMAHLGNRYLSPKVEQLVNQAVEEGEEGRSAKLSKRETEVLRMFAEGLSVSEIGLRAGRSSKTISAQKMAAMKKLGLKHDTDIFNYAQTHGLVQASQTSQKNARRDDSSV
ncbi:response regulator transcription factor [Dyella jejuensis]|uniref:Response regulator transcription factor n=1 Tax=Dyella jejuensis TaxID=1432009 RepID=A0ABW8JCN4_9GAMM